MIWNTPLSSVLVEDEFPVVLPRDGKDGVSSGRNRRTFCGQVCRCHKCCGFVCSSSPNFVVRNKPSKDLSPLHARAGVIDSDGFSVGQFALRLRRRTGTVGGVPLAKRQNRQAHKGYEGNGYFLHGKESP